MQDKNVKNDDIMECDTIIHGGGFFAEVIADVHFCSDKCFNKI